MKGRTLGRLIESGERRTDVEEEQSGEYMGEELLEVKVIDVNRKGSG